MPTMDANCLKPTTTKPSVVLTILLLSPMVLGLPFAMDIYVPALPHIADLFHISAGKMQLTLTMFMITAGTMQLLIGPLSDHFGRKKIAWFVTILFALGTFLCSFANDIDQLVSFRMLQAVGSCGMLVVAFSIVRDLYRGVQSAKVYSFLNGIIAFSPMFAPFFGSYLDVKFGWPSTFQALLIIAFFAWMHLIFFIPETLTVDKRTKFSSAIFKRYGEIIKNPIFFLYTFSTAAGLSYLYLFCSISPYIIIRLLHIPELDYGYYFFFMGISFFIGSLLASHLVTKLGIFKTVLLGFCLTLFGGILMTTWYFIVGLTINGFIWPMLPIGIGGTICMGAGSGGVMQPFDKNIGSVSALSGGLRFMFAAIVGACLVTAGLRSTLPLAVPAIVFSVIGIAIFLRKNYILTLNNMDH